MGQINFGNQKPKYCNLQAIRNGGSKANIVLTDGEIWMIDTNNVTKSADGKGKYNVYIKGDGVTMAKNLSLLSLDPNIVVPTSLSQLADDANHRTVTDEDKHRWNSGSGGGASTTIGSSDDIKVITDPDTALTHLEFADKEYDEQTSSGLGKVYLKKNLQTVPVYSTIKIFDSLDGDVIITDTINNAVNPVLDEINSKKGTEDEYTIEEQVELLNAAAVPAHEAAYAQIASLGGVSWGKRYVIDGRIRNSGDDKYINITPVGNWSTSYCYLDVTAGDQYKITAQKSDVSRGIEWLDRFWILTEIPSEGATTAKVIDAYKVDNQNLLNQIVQEVTFVTVKESGRLWINYVAYNVGQCRIEKIEETGSTKLINALPQFTEENTEYIVQYDYDLTGGVLELPYNSVLRFEGGNIKNGYIIGNNSTIVAPNDANIFEGSTILGTWRNSDFYPKWFGVIADGIEDDTEVLQKMLDISTNIGKKVNLMWYGYNFKTTSELYIKPNTAICGGNITAEFSNPLGWILQTYSIYESSINIRYYVSTSSNETKTLAAEKEKWGRQVRYKYLASWQEFDGGSDALNHVTGCSIRDLSISGTLCKHMVIPEGGDESSEKVWDNTYCPIFGGIKLNGASCQTSRITIRNTGVGMARGACLHSQDSYLNIGAKFIAYAAHAVNTTTVDNSYLNAWCNYWDSENANTYTPYYLEYQGFEAQPRLGAGWNDVIDYIEGTGGFDDGEVDTSGKVKPKLCSVKLNYASITFISTVTDSGAEVGFAATNSSLTIEHPYLEGVNKCYVYAALSRVTINMPELTTAPAEYDFFGEQCSFVLSNCANRICGIGGSTGANHKYRLGSSTDVVQILGPRPANAPEDSRFKYLSTGESIGVAIVNISDNISELTAEVEKYYKIVRTVNNLAVTLPAMDNVTTLKTVTLAVNVGNTPNITFTSADDKPIAYYENYGYVSMNSEYEISCLFNGTKWIIANCVIE